MFLITFSKMCYVLTIRNIHQHEYKFILSIQSLIFKSLGGVLAHKYKLVSGYTSWTGNWLRITILLTRFDCWYFTTDNAGSMLCCCLGYMVSFSILFTFGFGSLQCTANLSNFKYIVGVTFDLRSLFQGPAMHVFTMHSQPRKPNPHIFLVVSNFTMYCYFGLHEMICCRFSM